MAHCQTEGWMKINL